MPNGLPRIILSDILLPNAEPDTFRTLFKWLYERQPPDYTTDAKLLDLMKLWVRYVHVRTGYGTFTDVLHPHLRYWPANSESGGLKTRC